MTCSSERSAQSRDIAARRDACHPGVSALIEHYVEAPISRDCGTVEVSHLLAELAKDVKDLVVAAAQGEGLRYVGAERPRHHRIDETWIGLKPRPNFSKFSSCEYEHGAIGDDPPMGE